MKTRHIAPLAAGLVLGLLGATAATADISVEGNACIDALRERTGGLGGTIDNEEFSEAGTFIQMTDGEGAGWECIAYREGTVGELRPAGGGSGGDGGSSAGLDPDLPHITGVVRVQFQPGTSSGRYANQLGSGEAATDLLGARDGQFLRVDLFPDGPGADFLDFIIYVPDGDILFESSQGGNAHEGQLYESGDHRVEVFYNGNQGTVAPFAIAFVIR